MKMHEKTCVIPIFDNINVIINLSIEGIERKSNCKGQERISI